MDEKQPDIGEFDPDAIVMDDDGLDDEDGDLDALLADTPDVDPEFDSESEEL